MPINLPDTNIFIRFFAQDNKLQYQTACEILLEQKCYISDLVCAEVVYVLENHYSLSKIDVIDPIIEFIKSKNFSCNPYLLGSLVLYKRTNVSFYDCLILEQAKFNSFELQTFDKKLLKIYQS